MSLARLVARRRRFPPEAVYSHRTAAWLHGLDMPACDPIQVTLPQASTTSHLAGVSLMRSDFDESEVCDARGLPATTRIRTIADLGRGSPLVDAVIVLDMALRARIATVDELNAWVQAHPRH